jgi:N-acetylglucosamine repressor
MMNHLFSSSHSNDQLTHVERKNVILKLQMMQALLRHHGRTINDLCEEISISKPKAMELMQRLIQEDLVIQEVLRPSAGGRRPRIFHAKPNSLKVVCVEIERFHIQLSLVNNGQEVKHKQSRTFALTRHRGSLNDLQKIISDYIAQLPEDQQDLVAIGISMPGLINATEGFNYTYLTSDDPDERSINQLMTQALGLPVYLFNDIKTATLAELHYGLAKDKRDVLVILMDWGIGLGVVMDGALREGTSGFSGEMGHIPFVEDGALCYCGKKGCLETVASGIALARMVKEGIEAGQDSLLKNRVHTEINQMEPQLVINAAQQGDQYAINCLAYVGEKLGKGIAILLQLFNPELIILAGKMAEAKEYISIPLLKAINTYSMQSIREDVSLRLTQLGGEAGAMGIATQAIQRRFDDTIKGWSE